MSTPMSLSSTQEKKRPLSPEADKDGVENNDRIFISAPVHDRQSTFVAHFYPAPAVFAKQSGTGHGLKPLSLTAIVKRLQSHPSFASASHRIVAWRRRSSQQTLFSSITTTTPSPSSPFTSSALPLAAPPAGGKPIYATGSEDDGEKYAGKRLERLLTDLDVEGVVVVARWYGGVLLGPVRFTHIEDVAREAIRKWKGSIDASSLSLSERGPKRQRLRDAGSVGADGIAARNTEVIDDDRLDDDHDEVALRSRLAEQLAERDQSIVVLRRLLADKTKAASTTVDEQTPEPSQSQQQSPTPSSPAKKIDYSEMALARLKQLEKARDATIAFILRQLDKVEDEEKAKEKDIQRQGRGITGAGGDRNAKQGEQVVDGVDKDGKT